MSTLFDVYRDRLPREADLVCYWFVKAGESAPSGVATRIGLVATNSIRGRANGRALQRATENQPIFDAAIADAARRLVELRDRWLNPPEWVEWVEEPVSAYPLRPVPRDEEAAKALKRRTLTNLYNARPRWLLDAHDQLDASVAAAYGWPNDVTETPIRGRLSSMRKDRNSTALAHQDRPRPMTKTNGRENNKRPAFRNHIVPALLLRKFCGAANGLWMGNTTTGHVFRTSINNAFVEKGRYNTQYFAHPDKEASVLDFVGMTRSDECEQIISQIENDAAPVIEQIIESARRRRTPKLHYNDQYAVKKFILTMRRRNR